ncbi:hypothetical protein HCA00_11065 [Listeria booriae]|uniref:hypothetical protein n=1 Tax=Listeria booriae TaxID=1552123 RepID=UPI00162365F0|nr:hypothetical protein [Listeria booriae]MBC1648758.1 hypothetical protein [Listeria booriae]MBC6129346.1 hypothetical protein [Listeria booriae]MBC6164855.1 hypothetical protein [Listeria booriae]
MSGEKSNKDSVLEGLALGVGFVVVGVSLPFLFSFDSWLIIISTVSIVIGIMGFGIELEKFGKGYGTGDIFLGLAFLLLGSALLAMFPNTVTKIIFLILLLLGIFGFFGGILKFLNSKQKPADKSSVKKNGDPAFVFKYVIGAIVSILGCAANIVTILAFLSN